MLLRSLTYSTIGGSPTDARSESMIASSAIASGTSRLSFTSNLWRSVEAAPGGHGMRSTNMATLAGFTSPRFASFSRSGNILLLKLAHRAVLHNEQRSLRSCVSDY